MYREFLFVENRKAAFSKVTYSPRFLAMKLCKANVTLTFLIIICSIANNVNDAFLERRSRLRPPSLVRPRGVNQNDDDESRLDKFLDTPFFDPSEIGEDSPLSRFANLVETDYETAETLFAGSFFVVLVIISQELLRMQLHGDAYVPFMNGGVRTLF